jgi:hypothetical protein
MLGLLKNSYRGNCLKEHDFSRAAKLKNERGL